MYSKKNDKKPVLIPDLLFFFSSEDFKNGNKIQKSFKEFSENFFFYFTHSGEGEKKNSGWIQLNTLPLQSWSYK